MGKLREDQLELLIAKHFRISLQLGGALIDVNTALRLLTVRLPNKDDRKELEIKTNTINDQLDEMLVLMKAFSEVQNDG